MVLALGNALCGIHRARYFTVGYSVDSVPQLGFVGSLTATFSSDPAVIEAIENHHRFSSWEVVSSLCFYSSTGSFWKKSIMGYLVKSLSLSRIWFYAIVSLLLLVIVWLALPINPYVAFGAIVGSTAFFITIKLQNAETSEKNLMKSGMSDVSKIMYLEVIDATFSIDGVLGAFAYTLSIPLILIGNSIGALVVRQLTISNIDSIKKYHYLKTEPCILCSSSEVS